MNFEPHASIGSEISPFDEYALRKVLDLFQKKNLTILEIGSWVGMGSTKVFADYSETLICVDSWQGSTDAKHHEAVRKIIDPYLLFLQNTNELPAKIIPLRGLTRDILPYLCKEVFDVIFIDADHSYGGVIKDASLAIPLLKKNGILLGHDCEANFQNLDEDLLGYVNSTFQSQGSLCEAVTELMNKKLPDFNKIEPSQYPFLTPLIKFKHIHQGVIKAVSELNLKKAYFSDRRLEVSETEKGFSSIWVAKPQSLFYKNKIFEKINIFIKNST
jgi:predicted O-methyltransferase YrrM